MGALKVLWKLKGLFAFVILIIIVVIVLLITFSNNANIKAPTVKDSHIVIDKEPNNSSKET